MALRLNIRMFIILRMMERTSRTNTVRVLQNIEIGHMMPVSYPKCTTHGIIVTLWVADR